MSSSPPTDYTATLPAKRMGAGLLITDNLDRVLLVEPTYKSDWEIPGGAVEANESPHAAARREAAEELALTIQPGALLAVDWVAPRSGRTEGLMLIFDGGRLVDADATAVILPAAELRSWRFCDPDEAEQRLSPLLSRRVAASLTARRRGQVACLENGYSVYPTEITPT